MFNTGESSDEKREQQDFILRLIKQIIRALADMSKLRDGGKAAQALVELDEAYRSLLEIDPKVLHLLGGETLVEMYAEKGQLEALGLLLWEESCIRRDLRQDALSDGLKQRSLSLLLAARTKGLILTSDSEAILAGI